MSGGVDSSLAAVLLGEAGEEVVGVSMKLWPCEGGAGGDPEDACCSPGDARAVALAHDIPHYVLDYEEPFRREVVDGFLAAYRAGETPNPCIACNERLKFAHLWDWAHGIGASGVATGHYARVIEHQGRLYPGVPVDRDKDQTYFLFSLSQEQLARARFPLGELTKAQVRSEAARRGLVTADKDESMDLCFVGEEGVQDFLRQEMPEAFVPGDIVLQDDGRVLGQHRGVTGYTIGQRRGLGVAWREPLYVVAIDLPCNRLILGSRAQLYVDRAILRDCRWHHGPDVPPEGLFALVRNRHRAKPVPATILPDGDGGAAVRYHEAVMRPSPGQACVVYDTDLQRCLGGGWFRLPDRV